MGEFSSPDLTFCADSYLVSAPPCVTAGHVKDPGHSAKSAGGRLHSRVFGLTLGFFQRP